MAKISKKKKDWLTKIEQDKQYSLKEAIVMLKEFSKTKFDSSIDLIFRLGVDPKKGDQMIKGCCSLPHGTGKVVRVLVFAKGAAEQEAKQAGADFVGSTELIDKIQTGWLEFDRVVATPDMMIEVSKIGKILGPKGMMPNPKMDTVTTDVATIVSKIKKGQIEFRIDKLANLHLLIGKVSFSEEQITENVAAALETIRKLKPPASKGIYLQKLFISSAMGPGIELQII